jgi:hypothetical protein
MKNPAQTSLKEREHAHVLVDRLVHLSLAGDSYRLKEAQERAAHRASQPESGKKAR